ncbi:hypothetical protein HYH02_012837 [Chlamydomonas schloesseri]|uniref:Uncharacterized protein n=1 Tax=Chlamydomonas schloesseri TaxID=2026947 RepID=A0A835W1Z7_9CHLO|nr:hypothetical protein HYH02_012837 [Chlamydomonas schloesseri]|eukprot:KAG2433136.1 hypothetical protein HYH02_012837 [Chlamydomonas schloesseri]
MPSVSDLPVVQGGVCVAVESSGSGNDGGQEADSGPASTIPGGMRSVASLPASPALADEAAAAGLDRAAAAGAAAAVLPAGSTYAAAANSHVSGPQLSATAATAAVNPSPSELSALLQSAHEAMVDGEAPEHVKVALQLASMWFFLAITPGLPTGWTNVAEAVQQMFQQGRFMAAVVSSLKIYNQRKQAQPGTAPLPLSRVGTSLTAGASEQPRRGAAHRRRVTAVRGAVAAAGEAGSGKEELEAQRPAKRQRTSAGESADAPSTAAPQLASQRQHYQAPQRVQVAVQHQQHLQHQQQHLAPTGLQQAPAQYHLAAVTSPPAQEYELHQLNYHQAQWPQPHYEHEPYYGYPVGYAGGYGHYPYYPPHVVPQCQQAPHNPAPHHPAPHHPYMQPWWGGAHPGQQQHHQQQPWQLGYYPGHLTAYPSPQYAVPAQQPLQMYTAVQY